MNSKPTQALCPACFKGYLERKAKRVMSTFRRHSISYEQPGDWCDHCGEGILSGMDALATQAKLLEWRAHIDKQEGD